MKGILSVRFYLRTSYNDWIFRFKTYNCSLSLDLYEQNLGLDKNGQFRFTPPTHAMLAFRLLSYLILKERYCY